MDKIEFVFRKTILLFEGIPFVLTLLSIIAIIILTIILVKKELKEGKKK